MKKIQFSETQIISILKEIDAEMPVIEGYRKHGISSPTYNQVEAEVWRPEAPKLERINELDPENAQLKRKYADKTIEADVLKDVIE